MSREIKFRAWDGERMRESFLIHQANGMPCTIHGDVTETHHDWILEQFTGLKDKNGVEIHEGDIVSLNNVNQIESSDIYFQVKWCNDNYQWIIYHNHVEFYDLADFDSWVIGNIHQNPELLK